MLIKELRGTESTQDACAKMRVSLPDDFISSHCNTKYWVWRQIAAFQITTFFICWSAESHWCYMKRCLGFVPVCTWSYLTGVRVDVFFIYLDHITFTFIFKDLKWIVYTWIALQTRRKTIFRLLSRKCSKHHLTVYALNISGKTAN